jgi:phytoene/squalene synthetase
MMSEDFYQGHLDRVSRSFAFCIRQLPEPLREWVSASYLLCRTLDTIEDAPWTEPSQQHQAYKAFEQNLFGTLEDESWVRAVPAQIPDSEKALLNDQLILFRRLRALPEPVRPVIRELVGMMSAGMQHFSSARGRGPLVLKTLQEVNQYCFFVAGVVGELLAKLVAMVEPRFSLSEQNLVRAHHFGLFLQKVNLLKDQVGDEREGRHLIPDRAVVEASALDNAEQALRFLLDIPLEQIEFRRFCAWSLFLGLEAVKVARASLSQAQVLKVGRHRTTEILSEVESVIADRAGLQTLFRKALDSLGQGSRENTAQTTVGVPDWLLGLYRGRLGVEQLNQLGLQS